MELKVGDSILITRTREDGFHISIMEGEKTEFKPPIGIWCKDKEECEKLRMKLHERGYIWNGGDSLESPAQICDERKGARFFIQQGKVTYSNSKSYRSDQIKVNVDFDRVIFPDLYYNGKVVCVDNCNNTGSYTVGKIYEFQDGKMTTDMGDRIPFDPIHKFEEWGDYSGSKFIEVVE